MREEKRRLEREKERWGLEKEREREKERWGLGKEKERERSLLESISKKVMEMSKISLGKYIKQSNGDEQDLSVMRDFYGGYYMFSPQMDIFKVDYSS